MGHLRKRLLRGLALAFLSLLVALAVGELVLRRMSDAALGFAYQNGVFRHPREGAGKTTTNSLGFHDTEPRPKAPGTQRVLLLGDSYVAGLQVALDQTVGRALERGLNERSTLPYDVVAVGRPGWGQLQELEALRAHFDALQPDIVCLLFLSFNDVRNNAPEGPIKARARLDKTLPDRVRPGWTRVTRDEAPLFFVEGSKLNQLFSLRLARWRAKDAGFIPLDYFVYHTPVDEDWEAAWDETERLLGEIQAYCASKGARLVLASASTPHGVLGPEAGLRWLRDSYPAMRERVFDLTLPDRRMAEIAARAGIPFLALEGPIGAKHAARAHLAFDGHWSALGHAAAGAELAAFVLSTQ